MEAVGSVLTNKYAEGYPGKRYYGGCEKVDIVEDLARERACELFGANFANVQPHSRREREPGARTSALIELGDTVLGMSLAEGGHLTHGSPVNFSGKLLQLRQPTAWTPRPRPSTTTRWSAWPRKCARSSSWAARAPIRASSTSSAWRAIAHEVGAYFMVDMAHIAGLVAAGAHPSPVPYADVVTSTSHKTLRGPRGGFILANDEDIAKKHRQGRVPRLAGRPAHARHRRQGRCVRRGRCKPAYKDVHRPRGGERAQRLGQGMMDGGLRLVSGGTDNHLCLVDLTPADVTGKDAEKLLGERGPHGEQELHPQRAAQPVRHERHPRGLAPRPPRAASRPRTSTRWASSSPPRCSTPRDDAKLADVRAKVDALLAAHPLVSRNSTTNFQTRIARKKAFP